MQEGCRCKSASFFDWLGRDPWLIMRATHMRECRETFASQEWAIENQSVLVTKLADFKENHSSRQAFDNAYMAPHLPQRL